MPKISESTVAEHRAVQHRAVLDAAEKLIVGSDGRVPTLAEVAAEVGLARSSVYLYASLPDRPGHPAAAAQHPRLDRPGVRGHRRGRGEPRRPRGHLSGADPRLLRRRHPRPAHGGRPAAP
ncbi:hypothetical protein QP028_05350 [Corynebacterium suedekumii]|nr:hypothetical protein QP028_05350 [Corynebacterium suedekumii]